MAKAKLASNMELARAYIRTYAIYIYPTLYGLVPKPVDNLTDLIGGPMAVSEDFVLLYDPTWLNSISVKMAATGLFHECMHIQLRHLDRAREYPDMERFNIAADLVIYCMMSTQHIKKAGAVEDLWEFPEWAATPHKYGLPYNLALHEYYERLEDASTKKGGAQGSPGGENAQGPSAEGKAPAPPNFMAGNCGSVAGNTAHKAIEKELAQGLGRSPTECKSIAKETQKLIQQHLQNYGAGSIPGGITEAVDIGDEVFVVSWESILANTARDTVGVARAGSSDYSLSRPSRRSYATGVLLPGLVTHDPEVMFVVDSSASMSKKQLGDALRVCADVLRQTGIETAWYLDADTKVQRDPIRVTIHELQHMEIVGRGGTDFRPALAFAQDFSPRPDVLFYLTDGEGTAPAEEPRNIKVVWCIVPVQGKAQSPAKWGTHVLLQDVISHCR